MKETKRLLLMLALLAVSAATVVSQTVVGTSGHYDIDYLTPKSYEIGGITFEGADNLDTRVVQLVAGLHVGDKIRIPGDKLSAAVDNLWRQGTFEDVQIRLARVQGNIAFLTIVLQERPRLDGFSFKGVKNGDASKLRDEIKLTTGDVVTENLLRTSVNKIKGYYIGKGYTRAEVDVDQTPDSNGRMKLTFNVRCGKRVKVDSLIFEGNDNVKTIALQDRMAHTRDVQYRKKLHFWTKPFWKRSRYIENDFRDDLHGIIDYYNELGYRDARVVSDTVWDMPKGEKHIAKDQERVRVKVKVYEGKQFVFRNITFSGNTIYSDDMLRRALRIEKGDPYNRTTLQQNLRYNPSGTDISSLYMDNGYLFFQATPVEVAVVGDSIDIEVRIHEGKQARVRNVRVEGNTVTNDKVIMRELHTRPGDLFSRDALIRSQRELVTLGYFKQETIDPQVRPNEGDGTVDIIYKVEEGQTSTIQLQGGFTAGMVIGQVGLSLNNFSLRNIFDTDKWVPLPAGDGQKLSFSATTNGSAYVAVSGSFTEPWLGGKRPQSLTASVYYNLYSNGIYYKKTDDGYSSLQIEGGGLNFFRRLKWPDDYFIISHSLTFRHYILDNYSISDDLFSNGVANDLSYGLTISRNSLDSPIYARQGSEVSVSLFVTPPYSKIAGRTYTAESTPQERYRWAEYYKVNVRGSWMYNIVGGLVLNTRFRFGFMGHYNESIGLTPFGRYFLGGSGLSSYMFDGKEVVPMRGYDDNALSPKTGAAVADRFTVELRHPIIETNATTIWLTAFLEGGNSWADLKDFQPFHMYKAAGLGARFNIPMLGGVVGVDWGYGFDGALGGSHFHFVIGQSLD